MIPDSIFYPMAVIFVLGFLAVNALVNRGMNRADQQSPAKGAISATLWLLFFFVAIPVLCLLAAQLSGFEDVVGILQGK